MRCFFFYLGDPVYIQMPFLGDFFQLVDRCLHRHISLYIFCFTVQFSTEKIL